MPRWSLLPACALLAATRVLALSIDVPDPGDEDATTLPPLVVHPLPNPLGDPVAKLHKSLPDLGYRPPKKGSRLAENINDANDFQRGFFTQMLTGNPQLEGPPDAYVTEGDGELASRVDQEFEAARRASRR